MMNKKRLLAGMVALAIFTTSTLSVYADEENPKDTTVTYENRQIIPGESKAWGVVIPTAIYFTDIDTTADASLELVGINGYALSDLSEELRVSVTAQSQNGYYMVYNGKKTPYSITFTGGVLEASVEGLVNTDTGITNTVVAVLSVDSAKRTGIATLGTKPSVKGTYTDTITFGVSHTGNELK